MSIPLKINSIEIRNFLSFGDYNTKLSIAARGPVLISGLNGAGKSSLLAAFIWCLFGRTISTPMPGNKIVNWFSGSNCYIKITTSDGWEIIRTRNTDGHSELLLQKGDEDNTKSTNTVTQRDLLDKFGLDYDIFISSVFCGQMGKSFLEMAPTKRKDAIERLLGLDKINDYAVKAKEKYQEVELEQKGLRVAVESLQTDLERQEKLQGQVGEKRRLFECDRKSKITNINIEIVELEAAMPKEIPDLAELKKQRSTRRKIISMLDNYRAKIESNESRMKWLQSNISDLEDRTINPGFIDEPNIKELINLHSKADDAERERSSIDTKISNYRTELKLFISNFRKLNLRVESWEKKRGTTCPACEQEVKQHHVDTTLSPINDELCNIRSKIKELEQEIEDLGEIIIIIDRPKMSVDKAESIIDFNVRLSNEVDEAKIKIANYNLEINGLEESIIRLLGTVAKADEMLPNLADDNKLDEVKKLIDIKSELIKLISSNKAKITEITNEPNPYDDIIKSIKLYIKDLYDKIRDKEDQIKQLDILFSHYKYIYRSYSDRRKIKSWLLSELIPFLNNRIDYYLGAFDIDLSISFASTLSDSTDKWGYEFCSGGERKRIDLSIMFALYDLYMSLYGQQCNIMILDEVDSRLDQKGVQAFANMILDDFGETNPLRPETIFIISHKTELKDLFPSQIVMKKDDSFSYIVE